MVIDYDETEAQEGYSVFILKENALRIHQQYLFVTHIIIALYFSAILHKPTLQFLTDHHQFEITLTEQKLQRKTVKFKKKHEQPTSYSQC